MKPNTVGFTAVLADDEELILKRLEESVNWEELNIQLVSPCPERKTGSGSHPDL